MEKNLQKYSIIVDAMGGDFAPDEILKGAIQESRNLNINLILAGKDKIIRNSASRNNLDISNIEILDCADEVAMDDHPSDVIKHKKESSIYLGTQYAAKKERSAFLSAGNTGAVLACSLFNMKKIKGIMRPAIAVVIPLANSRFILIDAGANLEVKPVYLKQFASMGKILSQNILNIENPKIGLLNVGAEEKKGSEILVEAFKLLSESDINFIGNVEGRDIFEGSTDIVVCDGFVGNVLLKSVEGIAKLFFGEIKSILTYNLITKLAASVLKGRFKAMKKKFDYEEYGGAMLLGIDGISMISHGSSKAKAISSAMKVAYENLKIDIVGKIKSEITK
ncbi:MAG: phosphate acyltransferase PlsX [Actinobacteria bacterium]|nr:phosphate acyltransferase PlsX [Actinomycetota bacterium]